MSSLASLTKRETEKPEGGDGRPRPGRGRKPGFTPSEETRAKMSASHRRRWMPDVEMVSASFIDPDFDEGL